MLITTIIFVVIVNSLWIDFSEKYYRDHLEYLLIDDPKKPKKHEIIIDYKDNPVITI